MEKLNYYIKANIPPVIVKMTQDEGHEVLFSPARHSNLQPIETICDIVKGEVGCQYMTTTTFKQVHKCLKAAFNNLDSATVQGSITKANKNIKKIR